MNEVAVLVGLYKARSYLASKLANLAQQTYFHKSTVMLLNCEDLQGEASMYQNFLTKHTNVQAIRYGQHIRLYKTWNDGIVATTSKYVTNANVDDQCHPEYLEKCCRFLDEHPEVACVSSNVLVANTPNQQWPEWKSIATMPIGYPHSTMGPCPVWRRSLHDRYGYFGDYAVIGDADLWERWHRGNEQFAVIPEDLVLYFMNPNSLERRSDSQGRPLRDLDLAERSGNG